MASLRPVFRSIPQGALRLRQFSNSPARLAQVSNARPPIDPPSQGEMGVGELEGASFKIEPMRRVGEDDKTMRARLVYQSRKRGTLEPGLLLSTFADKYLPNMSKEQMAQYDLFMDENDWDIYYWATQETPPPVSSSTSSSSEAAPTTNATQKKTKNWQPESPFASAVTQQDQASLSASSASAIGNPNAAAAAGAAGSEPYRQPGEGEWAQTIGTFKPAYRPVPARWRDSEVLRLLREHVRRRSKGGEEGGGMGFMPDLKVGGQSKA